MGLGTALAIQAGTTAAGALANEIFGGEPEVPDFSADVAAEFNERRRDLDEILGKRQRELEASLAASGQTGSAGASSRQQVASEFAEAQADLASRGARRTAEAQRREEQLEFQQEQQEAQQRAQAIGDLVGGAGQALAATQLGGTDTSGADLSGEGGDATLLDAPASGGNSPSTTAGLTGRDFLSVPSQEEMSFSRFGITG